MGKITILDNELNYSYEEFEIKKKSGKKRKIVAPSKELKRYQRHASHKINWFFLRQAANRGVDHVFHGFIPERNAVSGASRHVGFEATLQMDFSNFFDNVKFKQFDEYLFEELTLDPTFLFHKRGYTAQGFPSSPSLCNLSLVEFAVELQDWLEDRFGANNYSLVIYADDISVSYNKIESTEDWRTRYSNEWREIRDFIEELAEDHSLEINKKKTRVRFAKFGWRRILGINVGDTEVRATRKMMSKIYRSRQIIAGGDSAEGHRLGGLTTWSRCILPGGHQLCPAQ